MFQCKQHGDASLVRALIRLINESHAEVKDLRVELPVVFLHLLGADLLIVYNSAEECHLFNAASI